MSTWRRGPSATRWLRSKLPGLGQAIIHFQQFYRDEHLKARAECYSLSEVKTTWIRTGTLNRARYWFTLTTLGKNGYFTSRVHILGNISFAEIILMLPPLVFIRQKQVLVTTSTEATALDWKISVFGQSQCSITACWSEIKYILSLKRWKKIEGQI
jgi:hypothetical protein